MSRFKTVTFISRNAEGGVPYKCAVNDVQLSYLISVSEFTSDNVARVQRHAAKHKRCAHKETHLHCKSISLRWHYPNQVRSKFKTSSQPVTQAPFFIIISLLSELSSACRA